MTSPPAATPPAPGDLGPTDRTRVRRRPERGRHGRADVHGILDEGLVAHVGTVVDGQPVVLPTAYGRVGDALYLHGAVGNHLLRALAAGAEACVTVTLLDGLVLARSAFHHSVNYRSVVVFGRAEAVHDEVEKAAALAAIVEHLVPGRGAGTRAPTPAELRATLVVRLPVDEASAKVRAGPPVEEPDDLALDHWAGVLPLALAAGPPEPDPLLAPALAAAVPGHVTTWSR